MTVEILAFAPESTRTRAMYDALTIAAASTGIQVTATTEYQGTSDLLMLWGPGHPARWPAMQAQSARGGHSAVWDASYWSRESKFRVSIDDAHPAAWVMRRQWPRNRWDDDPAPVANAWDQDGPIVVAGLGTKARVQYGAGTVDAWEADMMRQCRARWPGRLIVYRAKPSVGPIDQALTRASLLVTWHSNVAVDAIRMGIPVVCRDGAAAAVCSSTLDGASALSVEDRNQFLSNLAYFQWAPSEASECWQFLEELLR